MQLLGMVGAIFTMVEATHQGQPSTALQFDYLSRPWLNMGSTLSKASICLFFLRLTSRIKTWRIVLGVQVSLLLLVNLIYCITTLLHCRPLDSVWKIATTGQCWSIDVQHGMGYFQGAYDVFSALFIALFPLLVIQDLGIQRTLRWPFYCLSGVSIR